MIIDGPLLEAICKSLSMSFSNGADEPDAGLGNPIHPDLWILPNDFDAFLAEVDQIRAESNDFIHGYMNAQYGHQPPYFFVPNPPVNLLHLYPLPLHSLRPYPHGALDPRLFNPPQPAQPVWQHPQPSFHAQPFYPARNLPLFQPLPQDQNHPIYFPPLPLHVGLQRRDHLIRLPDELLRKVAGYLSFEDRESLMKTCKKLKNSTQGLTVAHINWVNTENQSRRHRPTRFPQRSLELVRVHDGKILGDLLDPSHSAGPGSIPVAGSLAKYVVKLEMGSVCPDKCKHDPDCKVCKVECDHSPCGLSYRLFSQFSGLKDLIIDVDLFKGTLKDLRLPERLQALRLYALKTQQRLKFCRSLCNLKHDNLRKLSVSTLNIGWSSERLRMSDPTSADEDKLHLPRLHSLAFLHVQIRASVLKILFWQWRNVKKVWFKHIPDSDRAKPTPRVPDNDSLDLTVFGTILESMKTSLEELYMIFHLPLRHADEPIPVPGILPSLSDFSKLRLLSIDPAVFVGVETCSMAADPALTYTGAATFAQYLPDSLEELVIVLNLEQTNRNPLVHYRSDLIEGILVDRLTNDKFPHLTDIRILEDIFYVPNKRCDTPGNPGLAAQVQPQSHVHCYVDHSTLLPSTQDPEESAQLDKLMSLCINTGILLWRLRSPRATQNIIQYSKWLHTHAAPFQGDSSWIYPVERF
ncbi:hypothetical protein LTR84_005663 [Exophiala bonariae]|uniref:F-box domain-containing protein n=1 Tax=Exophiala bonariae TaxID=1690606 RepID=A0AAV9N303_9EURO|nr:hypothetical protein LTR84_005663 [Exophiala bonariae]